MANLLITSTLLIAYMFLLMSGFHGSPIKRPTSQQVNTDCYGTECVVDLDITNEPIDVQFSENFTDAVLFALPKLMDTQDEIVGLLTNQTLQQMHSAHTQQTMVHNQEKLLKLFRKKNSIPARPIENRPAADLSVFVLNLLENQQQVQNQMSALLQNHDQQLSTLVENQQIIQNQMSAFYEKFDKQLDQMSALLQKHDQQLTNTSDVTEAVTHSIPGLLHSQLDIMNAMSDVTEAVAHSIPGLLHRQLNIMNANLNVNTKDCTDIARQGFRTSKVYVIRGSFRVYCDMETDSGGWTVIQRRFDGSVDFNQGWEEYANGFGSPEGEYWAGLQLIRRLTKPSTVTWDLRIDLEDFNGNKAYAQFTTFLVTSERGNYKILSGSSYTGTAGNALLSSTRSSTSSFKTKDKDSCCFQYRCAQRRQGAWWYPETDNNCGKANLNGLYLGPAQTNSTGMTWYSWKDSWEVLKKSEMKIRPARFI